MKQIIAPVGKYYTQAADVPDGDRVFATLVELGKFDKEENWKLVTEAEKIAWEARHRPEPEPAPEEDSGETVEP